MKNIQTSQVMAYDLSALENDLTYLSASSFFYDNTESDSAFLTYVMPYKLKERLKEVPEEKETNILRGWTKSLKRPVKMGIRLS